MIHIFNFVFIQTSQNTNVSIMTLSTKKNIDYIRASHNIFPPVSTPTSTIMVIRKTDRFVSYYAHWYVALHFVSVKFVLVFIDNLMIENTITIETAHQQHYITYGENDFNNLFLLLVPIIIFALLFVAEIRRNFLCLI